MNQATFIADCSFGSKMLYKTPAMHRDIFRDTLIAKKVWRRRGSNHNLLAGKHEKISSTSPGSKPRPTGWETNK